MGKGGRKKERAIPCDYLAGEKSERAKILFDAVRPLSACTVKPYAKYIPVPGQQLPQLRFKVFIVCRHSIARIMAIPRRKVNPELNAAFKACVRHFLHNIAISVFPGTVLDRMVRMGTWPKTESIVVLTSQD